MRTHLAPHIPHCLGVVIGGVSPQPAGKDACQLPGVMADKIVPCRSEEAQQSFGSQGALYNKYSEKADLLLVAFETGAVI